MEKVEASTQVVNLYDPFDNLSKNHLKEDILNLDSESCLMEHFIALHRDSTVPSFIVRLEKLLEQGNI